MAAQQLYSGLRRLALTALALVISFGLTACGGDKAKAPTLSTDDITVIERQAKGFLSARDRLPGKCVGNDEEQGRGDLGKVEEQDINRSQEIKHGHARDQPRRYQGNAMQTAKDHHSNGSCQQ